MPDNAEPTSYSYGTKILHWFIAITMVGLIISGWWIIDLSFYSRWYYVAPFLHKSFGVVVFLAGILLLLTKGRKRPAALNSHSRLEKAASKIAHSLLFLSILTIPITGYVFTTFSGQGVSVFDLFEIPAIWSVSETVRDLAIDFHIYASYGVIAVILAHAGGALKHHFFDKDRTLRRMTW